MFKTGFQQDEIRDAFTHTKWWNFFFFLLCLTASLREMALPNLWKIYASFRTPEEEREFSRSAFFKFSGYILSCIAMTVFASRYYRIAPEDMRKWVSYRKISSFWTCNKKKKKEKESMNTCADIIPESLSITLIFYLFANNKTLFNTQ